MNRLKNWWDNDYNLASKAVVMVLFLVIVFAGLIKWQSVIDTDNTPSGAEGLPYCLRECETTTLRLVSIELRNVGTGRGYVCHCAVREQPCPSSATRTDAGCVFYFTTDTSTGWYSPGDGGIKATGRLYDRGENLYDVLP